MNIQLSIFPENSGAIFSDDRKFRFSLWRIWNEDKPRVMFIGLNPSTANEYKSDATITRVTGFAKDWGFGGFYMLNLFTYITPYPEELKQCSDPEKLSDFYLQNISEKCKRVIFAWGTFKQAKERAEHVIKMFPDAFCLYKNNDGTPIHPLYVKADTIPVKF